MAADTPVLVHNCGNFDADDADGFWSREVEVDGKTMELGGQVSRNGDTLRIDGLMIYSKGVPGDQLDKIGVSGVNALKQQAIAWAKEDGIATIILPGKRHTPGKPRRDFNYVLDVASGRLRKGWIVATRFDSDKYLDLLNEATSGEAGTDEILRFLKRKGLSIVQSTIVYARRHGLSMSEAKEIVVESDTWNDVVAEHSNFHDTLERITESE